MDRDAPDPRVDLLVALAGPAVSLVLGVLAAAAALALPDRHGGRPARLPARRRATSWWRSSTSLPGLPLDGGRALRAAVWALTGDRHRGTEVAGWAGRAVAVLHRRWRVLAAVPAGRCSPCSALVFMLLIAVTLWQGAGQSIRLARISRRFPLVDLAPAGPAGVRRAGRHAAGRGAAPGRARPAGATPRWPWPTRPAGWSALVDRGAADGGAGRAAALGGGRHGGPEAGRLARAAGRPAPARR